MTRNARNALKASIKHWERMATGNRHAGEQPAAIQCALCREFLIHLSFAEGCLECPVMLKTGKIGCRGTPYPAADAVFHKYGPDSKQFKRAALKELKFLKSLL